MTAIPEPLLPWIEAARASAEQRGASILLVGGAVRDVLQGKLPVDLDFAVAGDALAVGRATANRLDAAFYVMDAERGTARVIARGHDGPLVLDFARCRGSSWDEDLRARDLTVNAIAYDLDARVVYDPLGGCADLERALIRQASPTSIADDPIRVMRVARFAAALAFRVDDATVSAAREAAPRLAAPDGPSAERARDELFKTLGLAAALVGVGWLEAFGALSAILPEREPPPFAVARALENAAAAHIGRLSEPLTNGTRLALLRLIALCAGADGAAIARRGRSLRLSAAEVERMKRIRVGAAITGRLREPRAEYSWMRTTRGAAPEAALLGIALAPEQAEVGRALLAHYDARYAPGAAPEALLTGQDILALGVAPGPRVGALLEAVREAQMIGEIETRDEALDLARGRLGDDVP